VLRNFHLLDVPPDASLREELEKKSYDELVGILKLHGPLHNVTDTVNRKRLIRAIEIAMHQSVQPDEKADKPVLHPLVLGIRFDRTIRRQRITERLRSRMMEGLIEEVEGLLRNGVSAEQLDYYGLEYRYVSKYVLKELSYEDMFNQLNTAIHQFAKRQMTYFRGMERRGIHIHWLEGEGSMEEQMEEALALIRAS
jgi:tRNA dimethylallyltransferase